MEKSGTVVYSPQSKLRHPFSVLWEVLGDLYRARGLIWILFVRDLKAGFRQSALGYFWLLAPPLGTAAVWTVLRSQSIIQLDTAIPYVLFVLIGTTVWASFVAFVKAPLAGFKAGQPVYTKLNVAAEVFIFSALLRVAFETVIRFFVLVPVFVFVGYPPSSTAFLVPIGMIACFSVAIGAGLLAIPIGALYDDVGKAISNTTGMLMYTVPVIFPLGREGWLNGFVESNPLTPGVAFIRDLLTTGSFEWAGSAFRVAGVMIFVGMMALTLIRVARPHLVARMGM